MRRWRARQDSNLRPLAPEAQRPTTTGHDQTPNGYETALTARIVRPRMATERVYADVRPASSRTFQIHRSGDARARFERTPRRASPSAHADTLMTSTVSTTALAVVLDDGPPSPLDEQRQLMAEVHRVGVQTRQLVTRLRREPGRGLLIRERRAAYYFQLARAGRPFSMAVDKAYQIYAARLEARSIEVPEDVYDAVFDLLSELEVPVNHLTDRLASSFDVPVGRDRTPERFAADRRALPQRGRLHARIAPGADLSAIQQRYMRTVRKVVYGTVLRALHTTARGVVHVVAGRQVPKTPADVSRVHAAADHIAAALVRSLYPTWGATTTPELVRKAVSRPRRT